VLRTPAGAAAAAGGLRPRPPALLCSPCAAVDEDAAGGGERAGGPGLEELGGHGDYTHFGSSRGLGEMVYGSEPGSTPLGARPVSRLAAEAWGDNGSGDLRAVGGGIGSSEAFGEDGKVHFTLAFGNVTVIDSTEGLVMIDTGFAGLAETVYAAVRAFSRKPIKAVIYTHGHVDHAAFHALPFTKEHLERGYPRTQVVAHENVAARFDRYKSTAGYNTHINSRQFQTGAGQADWFSDFRYPDVTYADRMILTAGDERLELIHAKGETDDGTIIWSAARKFLWPGDLWIWNVPNCGNPQKVQRYPKEWSAALKLMAELGAEVLFPGHGPPIIGAASIRQACLETAAFLDSIVDQCVEAMNAGLTLNQLLQSVKLPDRKGRTYLQSTYDDPRFIVANMWRRYAGWWDQDPAHLLPADTLQLSLQVCEAAGGPLELAQRALCVADKDIPAATQLVEYAGVAAPDDAAVHAIRAEIYRRRKEAEKSLMAQSIFADAERRSLRVVGKL